MTTMFIISLATVLAPIAINGVIAYFRPGAPAQEVKAKKVELAPANPWEYVGSKETDYTAPSSWEHVDDVPTRDTNVEADNELPTVDVTPMTSVTLAQDATFTTTVDNVIGGTDFVSGSVVTLAPARDGFEFVPDVPPVVPVEVPPVAPDVPLKVEPPTDTPDVPVEIPPVTPDVPLTDESVTVYWEEWEHYEKSVTITDFSWCFDSTYTKDGFVESTYMSVYEYRADTVADYYRNSVGTEYFTESTAVSECFFEEYSLTACGDFDGYGFGGNLDVYDFTAISASVSVHSEIVSETISEGSLVITK